MDDQRDDRASGGSLIDLAIGWLVPIIGGIAAGVAARSLGAGWPLAVVAVLVGGMGLQFMVTIVLNVFEKCCFRSVRKK
jgi:hypothetical protein